ncbi:MAG TPA: cytochrome bd-I oxidase subunit CydX [Paraburkholderia sp.]|uniref:cytochrome bd-I oxidase subunit CydX n=1 Tax=Paraburkholderia sp. TaxID=1926495 RepID=UPI002B45D727|nr:cytochrome bd-I oxidase subunit CydX [Paraburkholderia sp.]HKR41806.1 cytochrome bd-I oxidase subunit CydX [Paraburkholderia sp.]
MWYVSGIPGIGVAPGFRIISVIRLYANGEFLNGHEPCQTGRKNAPSADAGTRHGEACRP